MAFELAVIGSGGAAFAAAIAARRKDRSVVMVEHGTVGGTCVRRTLDLRPVEASGAAGADGVATDTDTDSTWDVLGRCPHGPLAGHRLQPVPFSFDKPLWFAWAAYRPRTRLHATDDELIPRPFAVQRPTRSAERFGERLHRKQHAMSEEE